jgi:hypothetical protein
MNLKSKLAAATLILASATSVQATTYSVEGLFTEPMAANDTLFTGTFDWDGASVTNLMGDMNSSMMVATGSPNLGLANSLVSSVSGNIVTAGVFLLNTTSTFDNGTYDVSDKTLSKDTTLGVNDNAFFTFQFDSTDMSSIVNTMTYGDCTDLGMMGDTCMTGKGTDMMSGGTMRGFTTSLAISEVSAVPVPAAAWLFGGALMSLFGVSRRKNILPAYAENQGNGAIAE